jgi:hypothetical protein
MNCEESTWIIETLVHSVLAHWRSIGIAPLKGASRQEVEAIEARLSVRLPDHVVTLYLAANGMAAGDYDDRNIRFWQLEELAQHVSTDAAGVSYAGFADFLIMSHVYEVRLTGSGHTDVRIMADGAPINVAASFSNFLDFYLKEAGRLYT